MRGKRWIALVLIGLLLLGCTGCKSQEEREAAQAKDNWENTSDEARMSIYCGLIKEYMLLTEDFGEDTPYPAMNRSVKGNMLSAGMTKHQAVEQAKAVLIQEQAVFQYGDKAGIDLSDAAVEAYIQEYVLAEIQGTEGYAAVDEACAQEGITYEDTIWAYEDSYKMNYILTEAGVPDDKEVEFVADLVAQYMESDAYAAFAEVLDVCGQLIMDDVTDKTLIGEAGIYMQPQ